jgi:hypothetical protein
MGDRYLKATSRIFPARIQVAIHNRVEAHARFTIKPRDERTEQFKPAFLRKPDFRDMSVVTPFKLSRGWATEDVLLDNKADI